MNYLRDNVIVSSPDAIGIGYRRTGIDFPQIVDHIGSIRFHIKGSLKLSDLNKT